MILENDNLLGATNLFLSRAREVFFKTLRRLLRRDRRMQGWLIFYCVLLSHAIAVPGQINTGEITGILTDPTGTFINRTTVTAIQVATQQKHTTATSGAGQYLFAQLPSGEYDLSVDAAGFKRGD